MDADAKEQRATNWPPVRFSAPLSAAPLLAISSNVSVI
jgi:hypothetical protein